MGSESDLTAAYSGQATAGGDESVSESDDRHNNPSDHVAARFTERELQRLEELADRDHLTCAWVLERLLADRQE